MNHFTIISNDCWGNSLYKNLNVIYNTPFIATFVSPPHYVEMLEQFPSILKEKIKFHRSSPIIGSIGGYDIVFHHYKTAQEAEEKWNRRVERVDFDNVENFVYKIWITRVGVYKTCKNYDYLKVLEKFHNLKFRYKISFTDENYEFNHPNNVQIADCKCAITLWNRTRSLPIVKDLFKNSSNTEI